MAIFNSFVWGIIIFTFFFKLVRSIRMVPTRKAYIVERLGKYNKTLNAGFHTLLPFLDRVVFIRDLKEEAVPVPPQDCFTKDEVQVSVDAVIYISVQDPVNASYGVTDYRFGAIQLAQTTTRSVIGTLDLDETFEERDLISSKVVEVMTEVEQSWGIKVHRYEIKNIDPPETVKTAMEKQVSAERNRQAIFARAEGDRESRINKSLGLKNEMINLSEGEMQRRVNEAEGVAGEISQIGEATASSITKLAQAIAKPGGREAMRLRLSQAYVSEFKNLAKEGTQVILPADLTKLNSLLSSIGLGLRTHPVKTAPKASKT